MQKEIILICILLLPGCNIKQNKLCKQELCSIIRQINTVYTNYDSDKEAEKNLNMLMMRQYYTNYTNQFKNINQDIAKINITDKYRDIYNMTNEIITKSIGFYNNRQILMSNLLEINSNMSSIEFDLKMLSNYKEDIYDSEYARDSYIEKLDDILSDMKDMEGNVIQYKSSLSGYDNDKNQLLEFADSLNYMAIKLNFEDTLSFAWAINDTNDILVVSDTIFNLYIEMITSIILK
jgi:hypothetical protein